MRTRRNGGPARRINGSRTPDDLRRERTFPLSHRDPEVPDAGAAGRVHARQALARAWRHRRRAQARHLAPAPRRQDRDGLPRLRPADQRADLRRQCRPDAGRQEVRAGPGLPPCHLCHVVDPRLDPGIHPALVVAGEDGHHRHPEEAVLQPAQGEEPDSALEEGDLSPEQVQTIATQSRRHRARRRST